MGELRKEKEKLEFMEQEYAYGKQIRD